MDFNDKNNNLKDLNPAANFNSNKNNAPGPGEKKDSSKNPSMPASEAAARSKDIPGIGSNNTTSPAPVHNSRSKRPDQMSGVKYAGSIRRLAAASTDGIILGFVTSLISFPLSIAQQAIANDSATSIIFSLVFFILQTSLYLGYYIYFIGSKGQTPGKMFFRIKVLKEDSNAAPGYGGAFMREILGKIVSGITLGLGYLWIVFDKKKQGFHDKIAGTVAIQEDELGTGRKILMILLLIIPVLGILAILAAIVLIGINPLSQIEKAQQQQMIIEEKMMQQQQEFEKMQEEMEMMEQGTQDFEAEYNLNEN